MSVSNILSTKGHRGFFKYHQRWGYSYRHNLYAKYLSADSSIHSYEMKTNDHGFRCMFSNHEFAISSRLKILLIGCSYAAGDGVSNEMRFSDQLMEDNKNLIIYNAALPGSGHDQQLLILQDLIKELSPNIVLFAPSTFCANRNLVKARSFYDPLYGRNSTRSKPYFEISNDAITINNSDISRFVAVEGSGCVKLSFIGKLFRYLGRFLAQRITRRELAKVYSGRDKNGLLLTNRIIQQIAEITKREKAHLFVVPLLTEHDLVHGPNSPMSSYFEKLSWSMGYTFISLEKLLLSRFSKGKGKLFLEDDGHYSQHCHRLISTFLSQKFENKNNV